MPELQSAPSATAGPGVAAAPLAMTMMIAAMLLLPVGDSFAKLALAASDYSGGAVAWARFALGVVLVVPVVALSGQLRGLGRRFLIASALRGALLASTIALIITGAGMAPIADIYGAFFIGPVAATLLARFVLREPVARGEWIAVGLGFVGVLLVVKPGGSMSEGLIWAFAAGCCFGGFVTATRWSAGSGPPLAQLAGQLVVGAALLSPIGLAEFATTETLSRGIAAPWPLLGSGVASAASNLLSIMALGMARASALAPLVYCQLISAASLSWLVFGDAPDALAALGLTVIAAAGLGRLVLPAQKGAARRS